MQEWKQRCFLFCRMRFFTNDVHIHGRKETTEVLIKMKIDARAHEKGKECNILLPASKLLQSVEFTRMD